jgi:hypothetical protein
LQEAGLRGRASHPGKLQGDRLQIPINFGKLMHTLAAIRMIEFFVAIDGHQPRLFIRFPRNATIHVVLRDFTGSRWSQTEKCWHFEPNRTLAGLLYKKLKAFGR